MNWDGRIQADARALPIADECVQCVVTSPPYFGLRDYGHAGQIGLEKTPQEYVHALLEAFREVWRVLRSDGVLWLNIGDSYASGGSGQNFSAAHGSTAQSTCEVGGYGHIRNQRNPASIGLKPKDLIGIPWMLAFALRDDGWYLRSDVIWSKPNPMPESVTDRPTRAHEYLFLLAKSERYYFDAEAIQEPATYAGPNGAGTQKTPYAQGFGRRTPEEEKERQSAHMQGTSRNDGARWRTVDGGVAPRGVTRNKRSVWTVSTAPYPEAHYATFPPALIEPCILAGSRPGDLVLDPFAGSGTVARVCEQYSRRWIGVDLGYQDLQAKRLTNLQKELVPHP